VANDEQIRLHADSVSVVRRAFDAAANSYDERSEIYRVISKRMIQRLDLLAATPSVVVDLGCGTGEDIPQLRKRYPKSRVLGLDLSSVMLAQVGRRVGVWRKAKLLTADAHCLPLET